MTLYDQLSLILSHFKYVVMLLFLFFTYFADDFYQNLINFLKVMVECELVHLYCFDLMQYFYATFEQSADLVFLMFYFVLFVHLTCCSINLMYLNYLNYHQIYNPIHSSPYLILLAISSTSAYQLTSSSPTNFDPNYYYYYKNIFYSRKAYTKRIFYFY